MRSRNDGREGGGEPVRSTGAPTGGSIIGEGSESSARSVMNFDQDAVKAKYLAERDKRLVPGRSDIRDLQHDDHFSSYRDDPFTPFTEREPIDEDVDVVIVGGGIAGLLAGARLREAGVERIRIIDKAGGIGGTWYWNRYPGVMCDVESYIYMPMLEELGYVPERRYAYGEEILAHLEAVARALRPGRRRPLPHRGHPGRVGRGHLPLAGAHRPWRRAARQLVRAGRGDPQPAEAPRHPRDGGVRRPLLPHGPLGLRLHRRVAARAAHQARGQERRHDRHRGHRHPVPAAPGRVGRACLRLPAHALGHRRPGQPPHARRLRRHASCRDGSGSGWTTSRHHAGAQGRRST